MKKGFVLVVLLLALFPFSPGFAHPFTTHQEYAFDPKFDKWCKARYGKVPDFTVTRSASTATIKKVKGGGYSLKWRDGNSTFVRYVDSRMDVRTWQYEKAVREYESYRRALLRAKFKKKVDKQLAQGKIQSALAILKDSHKRGNTYAAVLLAKMYLNGTGVKQDFKEASRWLDILAKSGSPWARSMLGKMYFIGLGVDQDYKRAMSWFKLCNGTEIDYIVGRMFSLGLGAKTNYNEATRRLGKASKNSARAMAELGEMYYLGRGIKKNTAYARKLFDEAAASKQVKALLYLSEFNALGVEGSRNLDKANDLMKSAKTELASVKERSKKDRFSNLFGTEQLDTLAKRVQGVLDNGVVAEDDSSEEKPAEAVAKAEDTSQPADKAKPDDPVESTDDKKAAGMSQEVVFDQLESLINEFYPKATITKNEGSLHAEFKVRRINAARQKLIPKNGGIVCDIKVQEGKYPGREYLPLKTNETLYILLKMAPYSEGENTHLLTNVLFSHDTDYQVIEKLKAIVGSFR